MDRNRIMNSTGDSPLRHSLKDAVPFGYSDCINVIDVLVVRHAEWAKNAFDTVQELIIEARVGAPLRVCRLEMFQFNAKNSPLDAIHPRVPTDVRMNVFSGLTMIAEHFDFRLELRVVGHDSPGFAKSPQVFARIKAKTTGDAHRACLAALVKGAMGLAGIFDDCNAIFGGNFQDGLHISRL